MWSMRNAGTSPAISAAHFQFFVGVEHQFGVAGKESRLQAVGRVVDLPQGLVEIVVRLDRHHRSEYLLAIHFHLRAGAGQHRGLEHRTLALSAAQQARAAAHRFLDPVAGADRIAFADQRSQVGGFIQRIASL